MPLKAQCKHCDSRLSVRDELAGKQVKCPKCGMTILISADALPTSQTPKARSAPRPEQKSAKPADEFESFESDDETETYQDEDEEFFDDPYGSSGAQLPPARTSASRNKPEKPKAAVPQTSTGLISKPWILAAAGTAVGLIFGLLIGTVLFRSPAGSTATNAVGVKGTNDPSVADTPSAVAASPQSITTATSVDSSAPAPIALPPARPELSAEQLADAADVRQVLSKMEALLAANKDREFLIEYGPVDELRRLQIAEASRQPLPSIPREMLLTAIKAVSEKVADVDNSALVASLSAETGSTSDSQGAAGPGYEGDVSAAISSAITDLEQDRVREFMLNMFPPDALQAMFRNGPERSFASMATKDSALVVRMLMDLKSLKAEKPQISGDVAEFSLPAVEYTDQDRPRIRPAVALYPIPDRVIRFSKINGHWRFYDDGSLRQTGALDGSVIQLKLERVGASWRLVSYPRI